MARILIAGDSFAADWQKKYHGNGWPNLLAKNFEVVNLAQAGCGQYKILLQIMSVLHQINDFDYMLIAHTSPYRIYVKEHPVHRNDDLHQHSDFIYADVADKIDRYPEMAIVKDWFEKFFDLEYAVFVHNLICEKIDKLLGQYNGQLLHITNLSWQDLYQFDSMLKFDYLTNTNKGLMNHYDEEGNREILSKILSRLQLEM